MLKAPSRPRAPSAATLRVLYQLAYISSGAAVGIGALCAEERRRRTQIVQRIADNAKRIRQSPRYAHGAAAAVLREQAAEDFGWDGETVEREDLGDKDKRRGKRAAMFEERNGAKMPELPSVVEEEYEELNGRAKKKGRRKGKSGRPNFVQEHGSREPVTRAKMDRWRPVGHKSPRDLHAGASALRRPEPKISSPHHNESDWITHVYRRAQRKDTQDGLLELQRPRIKDGDGTSAKATTTGKLFDSIAQEFATRSHWDQNQLVDTVPSWESLREDVDRFFEKVNSHLSRKHAMEIATHLLRLSMELGDMSFVRSFFLWKISIGQFKIEDIEAAIAESATFAEAIGPSNALDFLNELFATSTYLKAGPWQKFRLDMKLRAAALKVEELSREDGYAEFTDNLNLDQMTLRVPHSKVVELLDQECRPLMATGRLQSAIKLWCAAMRALALPELSDHYFALDDALFEAAIEARSISLCLRMLRLKSSLGLGHSNHQRDAFIRLCYEEGANSLLRRLYVSGAGDGFGSKGRKGPSPHSYMYLCRAFSEDPSTFHSFKICYNRLPPVLRANVTATSVAAQARALTAEWQATRSLDHSRSQYQQAVERLSEVGIVDQALRPLHIAMIAIDISAQDTVPALKRLTTLSHSNFDTRIPVLTALALAKRRDWAALERALRVLQANKHELRWTQESTRAFNNMLHIYSQHHTAQQLSDFAAMATMELDFRPNRATWEVLILAFVSKKALALLQYWLHSPNALGSRLKLDADLGAMILQSWYQDFRHEHSKVMWMCWELVQKASSLHSKRLLDFVQMTIGYDLKKNHGQNAMKMEPIIRSRQALVERSNGAIPRPGHIHNWMLYDYDAENDKFVCLDIRSPELLDGDAVHIQESPSVDGEAKTNTDAVVWSPFKHDFENVEAKADTDTVAWSPFKHSSEARMDEAEMLEGFSEEMGENNEQPPQGQLPLLAPDELEFNELRESYGDDLSAIELTEDAAVDTDNQRDLQLQMRIRLLEGNYESVLDLYQRARNAVGIPLSPVVLELAVEACLRQDNDIGGAVQLLESARAAGMDTTCAVGPLLIHKMRTLSQSHFNQQSAKELRATVMEYYRTNEAKGLHVRHDVGTHAAHILNNAGSAQHGVNLMSSIFNSHWCTEHPFGTASMTVWLLGFASLQHPVGMRWVVEHVLEQNMQIDMGFIRALYRARWPPLRRQDGSLCYGRQTDDTHEELKELSRLCHERRAEQMQASKEFGKGLIRVMVGAVEQYKPVITDVKGDGVFISAEESSYAPLRGPRWLEGGGGGIIREVLSPEY